jgi:hypothetical protein
MAVAVARPDGTLADTETVTDLWRDRIKQAREDRRRFEPAWMENLAFAAGQPYARWSRAQGRVLVPRDVEEQMERGELYNGDVITERRLRLLGELSAEDDRPELLLVDDGSWEEDFQAQCNRAVGYGWDSEWDGDATLLELRQTVIDLGTAAVQVLFDPTAGPVKQGDVPFHQGKPVHDAAQARQLLADGPNPAVSMRTIHEGAIRWKVHSPFGFLVPAGVAREKNFPWEILCAPEPISGLQEQYGQAAADLKEDTDIGNELGVDQRASGVGGSRQGAGSGSSRLKDHVWVYKCYRRPTAKLPKGRVVILASNSFTLLDVRDELPVVAPDGTYVSGISYFHWWRVTGRFWSRALVESMKDIQRRVNKRTNQIDKTIDRGQPYVIVDKGGNAHKRRGWPMEVIAVEPSEKPPMPVSGVQPGAWMYQDKEDAIGDLDRASGIGQSALGENPENAQTYGQLALLHEQESGKRSAIIKEHKIAIGRLVEASIHFIRTYWGAEKQIRFDADDNHVQADTFNATKLPTGCVVRPAKGSAKPRSQGAEIQKVNDIWTAALNSQIVMANAAAWVDWYRNSLEAGEALETPEQPNDEHSEKAENENHLLATGKPVTVAYYDPPQVHVPIHREAQVAADMSGEMHTVAALESHIQEHLAMARQVADQQAAAEAPQHAAQAQAELQPPGQPGQPPGAPQPPQQPPGPPGPPPPPPAQ